MTLLVYYVSGGIHLSSVHYVLNFWSKNNKTSYMPILTNKRFCSSWWKHYKYICHTTSAQADEIIMMNSKGIKIVAISKITIRNTPEEYNGKLYMKEYWESWSRGMFQCFWDRFWSMLPRLFNHWSPLSRGPQLNIIHQPLRFKPTANDCTD